MEACAVVHNPVICLIGQQVDPASVPFRGELQHGGQLHQQRLRVDPARGVVGAVDDHHPGPGRDGRGNGHEVQVERLGVDAHLDRYQPGFNDDRFVKEPGRQAVDHLVARIGHRLQRHRDGRETARGEVDVLGFERHLQQALQRYRSGILRLDAVGLVSEPAFVPGFELVPQRRNICLLRHLMGVPEGEVADPRLVLAAGMRAQESLDPEQRWNGSNSPCPRREIHPCGELGIVDTGHQSNPLFEAAWKSARC
ncbi:hypothetical protein D9M72_482220 [compost metagenome]